MTIVEIMSVETPVADVLANVAKLSWTYHTTIITCVTDRGIELRSDDDIMEMDDANFGGSGYVNISYLRRKEKERQKYGRIYL